MNETIELVRPASPRTYTQLVGMSFGALAAVAMPSTPVWPQEVILGPKWMQSIPSSSGSGQEFWPAAANEAINFDRRLAAFYSEFIDGQEPLGPEFEAVWDANVRTLYES